MTVALYARRKDWMVRSVVLHLRFSRNSSADGAGLERIDWRIELEGELTAEQRTRLIEIAQRCPMHRTLAPAITIAALEG